MRDSDYLFNILSSICVILITFLVSSNSSVTLSDQFQIRIEKSQKQAKWKDRQHNGKRKRTEGQTRSIKRIHKTNDRLTPTPLKTGDELRCFGRVGSSCSISGTRRVNLVTNSVISHKCVFHLIARLVCYTAGHCPEFKCDSGECIRGWIFVQLLTPGFWWGPGC
jgi:hypothetical protein